MRVLSWLSCLLIVGATAGCGQYSLVEPKPVTFSGSIIVEPPNGWNRLSSGLLGKQAAVWTVDGESLHALHFLISVKDGSHLMERPARSEGSIPVFRSNMTTMEIADLLITEMARVTGSSMFEIEQVRPEPFIGLDGFRIDFSYVGQDQVDRRGIAAGAVHDGSLHMILYQGSRLYHFDRYIDDVKAIIRSARLAEASG